MSKDSYGCFQKWWYPQTILSNRVFHYKPSILGYPYFFGNTHIFDSFHRAFRFPMIWITWSPVKNGDAKRHIAKLNQLISVKSYKKYQKIKFRSFLQKWVFPKIVVPQNGWFIRENPTTKWVIWGYHQFRKPPYQPLNTGWLTFTTHPTAEAPALPTRAAASWASTFA